MPQAGIGPNATLIFEVELLEINPQQDNSQLNQDGVQINTNQTK